MTSPAKALFGWWSRLDRSPRDVERDIDDEIAFHLECAARDLEAQGLSAEAAHAAARERFGDVTAITAACRKTQLGARIMLQRIQLVLLVVLVLCVGAVFWRSQAAQAASRTQVDMLRSQIARLSSVMGAKGMRIDPIAEPQPLNLLHYVSWLGAFRRVENWRAAEQVAEDLARLAPEDSSSILQRIFHQIESSETRQQILKAFVFQGGKSNALDVLHLGMTDRDATVREWALEYAKNYALVDFTTDPVAYVEWRESQAGKPLAAVLEQAVDGFLARLDRSRDTSVADILAGYDRRVLPTLAGERVFEKLRDGVLRWAERFAGSGTLQTAQMLAGCVERDQNKWPAALRVVRDGEGDAK